MVNTISLIKKIDGIIGPFLLKILPRQPRQKIVSQLCEQILVIRPGGLGDALLLLPVLKAVKSSTPDLKIDILCEPRNADAFAGLSFIDNLYWFNNPALLKKIFTKRYDIVFDTEQSHYLSAVLTRFIRSKRSIGFKVNGREKFYHQAILYSQSNYEVQSFWDLFKPFFHIPARFSFNSSFFLTKETPLSFMNLPEKFICIFPGASISQRLWPEDRWASVIDKTQEMGWQTVLLGGGAEASQIKIISGLCRKSRIINMCSQLSISQTAHLFSKARLLISTDSGILHLAVLCKIPTLSLFGPGIAQKWAPRGNQHRVINKGLPCSPCTLFGTTPPCPRNVACMSRITVDCVMKRLRELGLCCLNRPES